MDRTYTRPEPARAWVQAASARTRGELAGLGGGSGGLSTAQWSAASLIGSTAGGALVGFVSSGSREGAISGALFTMGLSGVADAAMMGREGHGRAAALLGLTGVAGLAASLYRAFLR